MREVVDQGIHGAEVGSIADVPALALAFNQACIDKLLQVEGKGGWWDAQGLSDFASDKACGACLDQ